MDRADTGPAGGAGSRAGCATFPTFGDGEHIADVDGRARRYRGAIPKLAPHGLADFAQAAYRLDRMAKRVPTAAPWAARRAKEWDALTFRTWMRRNLRTRPGRALMEGVIEGVWAAEPEDLSLLGVLFYIASADGMESLVSTEGGAQQDRFVGGSQTLALRLAESLDVRLGHPVTRIEWSGDSVTAEGVRAARAVVAVPPVLAGRIRYLPAMPGLRDQLTQRTAQGAVIKCHAVYGEPFWRADGLTGQAGTDAFRGCGCSSSSLARRRRRTWLGSPTQRILSESSREIEREVTKIDVLVSDLLASSRIDFTALTQGSSKPRNRQDGSRTRVGGRRQAGPSGRPRVVRGRRHTRGPRRLEFARECEASPRAESKPCASNRDQVSSRSSSRTTGRVSNPATKPAFSSRFTSGLPPARTAKSR